MNKLPNFASNKKCWQALNELVFGPRLCCPNCQTGLYENYLARYLWCKQCRRKYRPTAQAGSWLRGTKLQPRQLFVLLWCWQNRKSPDTARLLARTSYPSVQRWYGCFRRQLPSSQTLLLTTAVAADESFFGRQRSTQDQILVAGAISSTNQLRLRTITQRDTKTLCTFIQDTVTAGAIVVTDEWRSYHALKYLGYTHTTCNHAHGDYAGSNQIERVWSALKRYLRKLYGCIPTRNLDLILKEWEARHNLPHLFTNPETYLTCLFRVR